MQTFSASGCKVGPLASMYSQIFVTGVGIEHVSENSCVHAQALDGTSMEFPVGSKFEQTAVYSSEDGCTGEPWAHEYSLQVLDTIHIR